MTKMKESGIDWIGQIPQEWEVKRIKNIASIERGASPRPIDKFISDGDTGVNWIRIGDTYKGNKYITSTKLKITNRGKQFSRCIHPGTLILSNSMSFGEPYISSIYGCIHDGWLSLAPNNNISKEYLYWLLLSDVCTSQFNLVSIGAVVENLSVDKVGNTLVSMPYSLYEQQKIADFLDKKTAQLDKVKTLLEEQIQKLKDYRASLIYETVTKGLDKNVPMKDSGVDWIGQVPQGWEIVKFKYFFNTSKGLSITKECLVDEGIPVINYGQIHSSMSKQVQSCDVRLPFVPDYYLSKKGANLNHGDFVFADTSEDLEGAGNFSTRIDSIGPLLAGYHTIIARLNNYDEYDFRYFMHLFDSLAIRKQIQNKVSGIKVYSITQGILNSIFVIIPPQNEQQKIANLLDEKTAQIDNLIQIKNQQIKNINRQRQTLIYDYVTGKRRV